jgi:Na+-transporting NADH:ubiquinone oxidoreductase subunit B
MLWTILSAAILTVILYYNGVMDARFPGFKDHRMSGSSLTQLFDILGFLMAGSLAYAAVFMSTDPVSSPKKPLSQHLYGIIIGALTVTIRVFAGFSEGVSFAILTANTFASLIDEIMPAKKKTAAKGKPAAATQGGDE